MMTPLDIAEIIARRKRVHVWTPELDKRQLAGALYRGLVRWDMETEGVRPAYVVTEKGLAALAARKARRKEEARIRKAEGREA